MRVIRVVDELCETSCWTLELSDSELLRLVEQHSDIKEAFREFLRIVP